MIGSRIDRYWFAPAPAERLAVVRILVATFATTYIAVRLPYLLSHAQFDRNQFHPAGVVSILDRPLVPIVVQLITIATALCSIPFLIGWRFRIFGPLFALLLLWTLSYRNSWGQIWHTENLMVIQVLILGVVPSADAFSVDARGAGSRPEPNGRYGWPLRLMCWGVAIAYVIAGVAKLRNGGLDWLSGDVLRNQIAVDNLRKALLGGGYSPIARFVVERDWVFHILGAGTIVFELGAPVALLGRRLRNTWIVIVLGFHYSVLALMWIFFPYQMTGFAFVCFFPVERPAQRLLNRIRSSRERRTPGRSAAP